VFNHIVVGNEQAWALLAIVTAHDAIGTVKDASIKVVVKQLGKRKTSGSKSKCAGDEEVDSLIKALQAASVVHKSAKMKKAGWGLVCYVFVCCVASVVCRCNVLCATCCFSCVCQLLSLCQADQGAVQQFGSALEALEDALCGLQREALPLEFYLHGFQAQAEVCAAGCSDGDPKMFDLLGGLVSDGLDDMFSIGVLKNHGLEDAADIDNYTRSLANNLVRTFVRQSLLRISTRVFMSRPNGLVKCFGKHRLPTCVVCAWPCGLLRFTRLWRVSSVPRVPPSSRSLSRCD